MIAPTPAPEATTPAAPPTNIPAPEPPTIHDFAASPQQAANSIMPAHAQAQSDAPTAEWMQAFGTTIMTWHAQDYAERVAAVHRLPTISAQEIPAQRAGEDRLMEELMDFGENQN